MKKQIITAFRLFIILSIVTGVVYPLLITGLGQLFYPSQANGSLVYTNKRLTGSTLIGQGFDSTCYFWSRPSAINYNTMPSGGSNLGPTSQKLANQVKSRESRFRLFNNMPDSIPVPSEMVFASGSGLDPHISKESALLQINRVAEVRQFDHLQKVLVVKLVDSLTLQPQFHLLGQQRINVFLLNLELDKIR